MSQIATTKSYMKREEMDVMYARNLRQREKFQSRKTIRLAFSKDEFLAVQIRLMADDPQIQKDLSTIAEEFSMAELDGLEKDFIIG